MGPSRWPRWSCCAGGKVVLPGVTQAASFLALQGEQVAVASSRNEVNAAGETTLGGLLWWGYIRFFGVGLAREAGCLRPL